MSAITRGRDGASVAPSDERVAVGSAAPRSLIVVIRTCVVAAAVALLLVLGFSACGGSSRQAVRCEEPVATLDFDPDGKIEVHVRNQLIVSADAGGREFTNACAKAVHKPGYFVANIDTRLEKPATLTCRFPQRFWVQASSTSASWAGERPAGSSVALILGKRAVPGPGAQLSIVAGATVMERSGESDVFFDSHYCKASRIER
jgi:hypothetical protein